MEHITQKELHALRNMVRILRSSELESKPQTPESGQTFLAAAMFSDAVRVLDENPESFSAAGQAAMTPFVTLSSKALNSYAKGGSSGAENMRESGILMTTGKWPFKKTEINPLFRRLVNTPIEEVRAMFNPAQQAGVFTSGLPDPSELRFYYARHSSSDDEHEKDIGDTWPPRRKPEEIDQKKEEKDVFAGHQGSGIDDLNTRIRQAAQLSAEEEERKKEFDWNDPLDQLWMRAEAERRTKKNRENEREMEI